MSEAGLTGKTVVVLGASGPYGSAVARMLAHEGANLALGGRNREQLEALQKEVEASGGRALVVGTHLAKRHYPVHLVEAAVEQFGGLDALLFVAYSSAPSLESLDVGAWERSVDVNLKGFLYSGAAALPALCEGPGGHVIALGVESAASADSLYRAALASVRALVEELNDGFPGRGISADFLMSRQDPEQCAETMRQALLGTADPDRHPGG